MKDKKEEVYWGEVEYEYLPGSVSFGTYKGGFVYIFINAWDVLDCIPKIKNEFKNLSLKILSVSFLAIYDNIPWETEEDQKKYDMLADEAKTTGKFICDDFMAYERE